MRIIECTVPNGCFKFLEMLENIFNSIQSKEYKTSCSVVLVWKLYTVWSRRDICFITTLEVESGTLFRKLGNVFWLKAGIKAIKNKIKFYTKKWCNHKSN